MGSEPNAFQEKRLLQGKHFTVAVASTQGEREYMQDVFAVILEHTSNPAANFFGIFDGHGVKGEKIAHYTASKLGTYNVHRRALLGNSKEAARVVRKAFLDLDKQMLQELSLQNHQGLVMGGSTAVAVWATMNRIVVAHVGDSRAILSRNGQARLLTTDHKPASPKESNRIFTAGGFVYMNRVLGILAVSRAFGDYRFKNNASLKARQQMVSAEPDVVVIDLDSSVDFLVLTSDGVTDVLDDQTIVDLIHGMLQQKKLNLDDIAMNLAQRCLAPTNNPLIGKDNATLLIILVTGDKKNKLNPKLNSL